ncbi:hypothetical protein MYX77_03110 [Acidobacteriia bacterium AH_259_A11_L15]|nr:hypothetical protein [Acidobacteriia bacterium AH_259_A11_L15]
MPTLTGSFDNVGSPVVRISVSGPFEELRREFDAIIDTGFSGFLSMPIIRAFPLGLLLSGATSVQLADGSIRYRLTAIGRVTLGTDLCVEAILLETGSDAVLAGMDLLKRFRKRLVVSPETNTVLLEDEPPPQPVVAPPATPTP